MFRIYKYKDEEIYGLLIDKQLIELGNIEKINSFNFIRVDDIKEQKNDFCIAFDSFFDIDTMSIILNLCNNELKKNNHKSIESLLTNLSNYFSKTRRDGLLIKYIGLISELFFIKWCRDKGIELEPGYQKGSVDLFDIFFNGFYIEVKFVNKDKKTISMNHRQLEKINEYPTKIFCTNLIWDSNDGYDLNQIFELVKFNDINLYKKVKNYIKEIFISNESIFDQYKINIQMSDVWCFDETKLPDSKFLRDLYKNDSFISASFEFKVIESNEESIVQLERIKNDFNR